MKNIIWLASYPKSGNTLIRLFLSCYLFSKEGTLEDFNLIRNIILFNHFDIFNKIEDICNKDEFVKNPEKTVQDILTDTIAKLGENITIKRFVRFQLGETGNTVPTNN